MPTFGVTKTIVLTCLIEAEDAKTALAWCEDSDDDTGDDRWDDRHEETECREQPGVSTDKKAVWDE